MDLLNAIQIAHWPGQDVAVCDFHMRQIRGLAQAMGFTLSFTPCEATVCKNCDNELRRKVSGNSHKLQDAAKEPAQKREFSED
jgi:hypothetical protein